MDGWMDGWISRFPLFFLDSDPVGVALVIRLGAVGAARSATKSYIWILPFLSVIPLL
jgi:hypothetical protein